MYHSICTYRMRFNTNNAHGNFLSERIGFLVGLVLASVMLGVVGSAVDTVIVCYAESPAEFEQNHRALSVEMRKAYREAWPELSHTF